MRFSSRPRLVGSSRHVAPRASSRTRKRPKDAPSKTWNPPCETPRFPGEIVRRRLLDTAPRDIRELLPQLEERADLVARRAAAQLRRRGEAEERQLRESVERQRQRVKAELSKHEGKGVQRELHFSPQEKRQLQADVSSWRRRLHQFDRDLETEPARIREFYEVRAQRVEPVGLVYLWPDTG